MLINIAEKLNTFSPDNNFFPDGFFPALMFFVIRQNLWIGELRNGGL